MRNPQITYFRVTAMFMVVFYHCMCFYGMWPDSTITVSFYQNMGKFIHSIDMPVFMFLSGFLYFVPFE